MQDRSETPPPPASAPSPHAGPPPVRARSNVRGRGLAALLLVWTAGCGGEASALDGEREPGPEVALEPGRVGRDGAGIPLDAPVPEHARRAIREFLEVMLRPPLDETSDVHDRWYHATAAHLQRLVSEADEDVGNAALHAFTGNVTDGVVTRRALLIIGARCSPRSAAPLLREYSLTYGYRLDDRSEATVLWAEVDPQGYLSEMEPHLRRRERPTATMPNDEFLLRGWIEACERAGRSPVPVCADVAVNIRMEAYARYMATEELGRHPDDPLARHALETCLIESTGDGYLRVKAAQAIRMAYANEDACALFQDVLSKEASFDFSSFLQDMIKLLGCR